MGASILALLLMASPAPSLKLEAAIGLSERDLLASSDLLRVYQRNGSETAAVTGSGKILVGSGDEKSAIAIYDIPSKSLTLKRGVSERDVIEKLMETLRIISTAFDK